MNNTMNIKALDAAYQQGWEAAWKLAIARAGKVALKHPNSTVLAAFERVAALKEQYRCTRS